MYKTEKQPINLYVQSKKKPNHQQTGKITEISGEKKIPMDGVRFWEKMQHIKGFV